MANFTENAIWEVVYQLATTDPVLGGPGGASNNPLQNLVNRTAYLKNLLEVMGGAGDAADFGGNMNSLKKNGFFNILSAATNKPVTGGGMAVVISKAADADFGGVSSTVQIYVDKATYTPYFRTMTNGAVNPWAQAVMAATYNSFLASLVGMISPFPTGSVPSGWLECDGTAKSRTVYAALFAKIGTAYGVGDGSTTFNVPDLRGRFVRGWDHGAGVDSGRSIGSYQADAMVEHVHLYNEPKNTGTTAQSGAGVNVPIIDTDNPTGLAAYAGSPYPDPPPTSTETRPKNVALMYCIKT